MKIVKPYLTEDKEIVFIEFKDEFTKMFVNGLILGIIIGLIGYILISIFS